MSLSQTIFDAIENNIKLYISDIANKYELDQAELYKLWNNSEDFKPVTKIVKTKEPQKEDILDPELMKLNKKELSEMCKAKNLPISGTKADLIRRLVSKEVPVQKSTISSNKNEKQKNSEVVKKLVEKIPPIQIKKNSFGNYEHSESKLVFNNTTKRAFGRQNPDGTIAELTMEDIDLCHKYKFTYDMPENLDKKLNINDDEEDEELDDEEEVVEEELDEEVLDEEDDDDDLDEEEEIELDEDEYYDEE